MATKKTDVDVEIGRLYRRPLDEFISARNDLAKQLRKLGVPEDAERVRTLPKPTPSAWAVNLLFEREPEKMERLLGTGRRALAAQREAVSGRGVASLREHIETGRSLTEQLRRRAVEILAETGRAVSRALSDRIGTNLQALALSPAAAEEASRGWIGRDLDPPGFEVLAGLQVASAPVVDLAARRAEREAKRAKPERERKDKEKPSAEEPPGKPGRETAREERERGRREAVEKARREQEEEKVRRRVEVAQTKLNRARDEADALRKEAERLERVASEARRKAEESALAASRARDRADRAAERLARAEEALREAQEGGGG